MTALGHGLVLAVGVLVVRRLALWWREARRARRRAAEGGRHTHRPSPELATAAHDRRRALYAQPMIAALCPRCGATFDRHPLVVEPHCASCQAARFSEAEEADVDDWKKRGWK